MIYGFKSNKCKEETYSKDNLYTKDEIDRALNTKTNTDHTHDNRYYTKENIDTVQTATVIVNPTDTSVGKAELTFRRAGKTVYVRIKLTTYANKNQLSFANKVFTMPEFAKTSEDNVVLLSVSKNSSYGYAPESEEREGEISLNNLAGVTIRKNSSGNYSLSGYKSDTTTQENENSMILTGTYII